MERRTHERISGRVGGERPGRVPRGLAAFAPPCGLVLVALGLLVASPPAVTEAQITCEEGVADSCVREGDWHIQNRQDYVRAERLYKLGCDRRDAASCGRLGLLYRTRSEFRERFDAGAPLVVDACRRGDGAACDYVVRAFLAGDQGIRSQPAIREALHARCGARDDGACTAEGLALERGIGGRAEPRAAAEILRGPCGNGRGDACGALARALAASARTPDDRRRAEEAAAYGCRLGNGEACAAQIEAIRARFNGAAADAEIVPVLERACAGDHAPSCVALGRSLEAGPSVEPRRVGMAYQRACQLGDDEGCGYLGILTRRMATESRDAEPLLRRGCDAHVVDACAELGGWLVARGEPAAARPALESACSAGRGPSCAVLARLDEGTDPTSAAAYSRRACEAGVPETCLAAARAIPPNRSREAAALLSRGCAANLADACAALADRQSGTEAQRTREKACELGHAESCGAVARSLSTRDPARARALHGRACDAGEGSSCLALAEMEARGAGGPVDADGSHAAARRACDLGEERACAMVAEHEHRGAAAAAAAVGAGAAVATVAGAATSEARPAAEASNGAPSTTAAAAPTAAPQSTTSLPTCSRQDPQGCEALGRHHLDQGRLADARAPLQRACTAGRFEACRVLGVALLASATGPTSRAHREGTALVRRACEGASAAACEPAARAVAVGGGARAERDAVVLAERGASADDPPSLAYLGELLARRVPADAARVLFLRRKACDRGVSSACRQGLEWVDSHEALRTSHRDDALALDLKGCELEIGAACQRGGMAYAEGAGLPRDPSRGAELLERACHLGVTDACGRAAELLQRLEPTAHERIADVSSRACGGGDLASCDRGARELIQMGDSDELRERAASLFAAACSRGRVESCALAGDTRLTTSAPYPERVLDATSMYRAACGTSSHEGCQGLLTLCSRGQLVACDSVVAACDEGVQNLCPSGAGTTTGVP